GVNPADFFDFEDEKPIADLQAVNVYDSIGGPKKHSEVDGSELFLDFFLKRKEELFNRFSYELSKDGTLKISYMPEKKEERYDFIFGDGVKIVHKPDEDDRNEFILNDEKVSMFIKGKNKIEVDEDEIKLSCNGSYGV